MKTITWARPSYTLYGGDVSYGVVLSAGVPGPLPEVAALGGGRTIRPGDAVVSLGGSRRSAGFVVFTTDPGRAMEYMGSLPGEANEEGKRLLLFRQRTPDGRHVQPEGVFLAYLDLGDGSWFFANRAGSGRLVEAGNARLAEEAESSMIGDEGLRA